jgi:UDP-N-acetylglucosamine 3-dehydrogenase
MIRVAVVGVGSMGKNHARVYQDLSDVELVAIVDKDKATAQNAGRRYHVPAYHDICEMVEKEKPEAVSVVVPTQHHFPVVKQLLEAGCHVLVEKPIANSIAESQELVTTAKRLGRILMVGHIERFNPAVIELKSRLEAGELGRVFQIHTRRLGPFPSRIQDVGVVMDLATHDLDIMRYLTGSEVIRVYSEIKRELHTSQEDLFAGILRFEDGTIGILEINWLTPTKIRELYVTGERGMYRVNYITQDLCFFENAESNGSNWSTLSLLRGVSEGMMIQYAIHKQEPLLAELESFISCVKGNCLHLANGYDAQAALELAEALVDSARIGGVKKVSQNVYSKPRTREHIARAS